MSGFEYFLEQHALHAQPYHLSKHGQCALGTAMAHSYVEHLARSQSKAEETVPL